MTELKTERRLRIVIQIIFLIYFLVLLKITLFKYVTLANLGDAFFMKEREISIIPFRSAAGMIKYMTPLRIIENIAGNIIIFIPFGWLLPLVSPFEGQTPVYGFILSLLIETTQYIFAMGFSDIDDLILNTLGAFIGYWIYLLARRIIRKQNAVMVFFIIVTSIGTGMAIIILQAYGMLF